MTLILHAMLGKGLGGLEQVFLDYQPILEAYAGERGGSCLGLVRSGGKMAQGQAGRTPPLAGMPAYTDWDPLSLGAARAIVARARPRLILSHGQRPARLFAKAAPGKTRLAVCIHKPAFDVEASRTSYLCVGRHLAELAVARGVPAERVHVVPNAVRAPCVSAAPFARREGPALVVAAGRLHPKKGFDVLIAAVARLRAQGSPVRCEIAGEGPERPFLEREIARHGLDGHVRLVGWRADIPAFLAQGDIFAFPSRQEGFPLVLLEAMSVGLPAVAANIPGPDEMIAEARNGMLRPPDDPVAFAGALAELIASPGAAVAMGAEARRLVLEEYGMAALQRRLYAFLDAALA